MQTAHRVLKRPHSTTVGAFALALVSAAFLLSPAPSWAQGAVPADKDACLQQAFDLASEARKKGLSEAQLADLEPLMEKLEGECDSNNLEDAAKTAGELSAKIGS